MQTIMIIVTLSRLIAGLAHTSPYTSHWLMLRRPGELHLVHRMFLAKEFPAFPAINAPVGSVETLPARRL